MKTTIRIGTSKGNLVAHFEKDFKDITYSEVRAHVLRHFNVKRLGTIRVLGWAKIS